MGSGALVPLHDKNTLFKIDYWKSLTQRLLDAEVDRGEADEFLIYPVNWWCMTVSGKFILFCLSPPLVIQIVGFTHENVSKTPYFAFHLEYLFNYCERRNKRLGIH